jgi:hypothetical protein
MFDSQDTTLDIWHKKLAHVIDNPHEPVGLAFIKCGIDFVQDLHAADGYFMLRYKTSHKSTLSLL